MPVCFHGRGRVRCGWGCALRFLAAWVDVILSCSFLLLLSYIVANVELLDVVRHDELLFRFLQPNLDKPLDADAYLRRAVHHFLVQLRALHVGEHLSRLFTFRLCRVRVLGGLAGVVNLVKAAARSPWRVRGVLFRFVVPVSQFLRRYAREGLIEFFLRALCRAGCVSRFSVVKSSLFLRQLNAFFNSGGFLRRYGSGCPGGCHPETALAEAVRLFRTDFLVCRYAFSLIPVQ